MGQRTAARAYENDARAGGLAEEGKELIGDHDRANGISCQDVTEPPIWRAVCACLADAGVVDKDVESVVEVSNSLGCFVD